MYIWGGIEAGIIDADTGESIGHNYVREWNALFTDPPVWGMVSEKFGIHYNKIAQEFVKYITGMERTTDKPDASEYAQGLYIVNGVIKRADFGHCTLYTALKDRDLSNGVVYFPYNAEACVKITFDKGVGMFLAKAKVLHNDG